MSYLTGTNVETIYKSTTAGAAKGTFTSEFMINDVATMGAQAVLPPYFWLPVLGVGKAVKIEAWGILSSTATPTYTFTTRLGASGTTAASVLVSAALTTGSGVTNQLWEFHGVVTCLIAAGAGANSTFRGVGSITCGGLASPFSYSLYGSAATPGTIATVDISIANYISFNVTCSASSASNTVTLQDLLISGLN
jgi:hypothetical protein